MSDDEIVMTQFVVYEKPRDFPSSFVVRRWFIVRGNYEPVADRTHFAVAPSLDAARSIIPAGLYRLPRDPSDDPVIVETWI